MSNMEPAVCHGQLQNLLADEYALLNQLEHQLCREHELLLANDVDGLENAGQARQGTVAALLRLETDRQSLCRLLGHSADAAGLAALLKWCDPAGSLASTHADVAVKAAQRRTQNDRNGALVTARLARVQNMLGMLNVGGESSRTYSGPGSGPANVRLGTGRLLVTTA